MQPHDLARELMDSASADLYVLDQLIDDPGAPDTVLGFHFQQAAEKLLKAVLTEREHITSV